MKKKVLFNILYFIPAIIIMGVIFLFSAQDSVESSEISGSISYSLVIVVDKIFSLHWPVPQIMLEAENIHNFIRKAGHFTEYMFLGISLIIPIYKCSNKSKLRWFWAWIICIMYAVSDEIHQLFVAGRYCSLKDVFIDSMGAISGILIVIMFIKLKLNHLSENHI